MSPLIVIIIEYKNIVVPHLYTRYQIANIMKLQKQKAREYKGKPIYKYIIVIPPKDIVELDWIEGIELDTLIIKDKGLFISKKS